MHFLQKTALGVRDARPRNKAIKSREEGEGVRETKRVACVCVCRAQISFFFRVAPTRRARLCVTTRLRREPRSASRFFFAPEELRMGLEAVRGLFPLDARRAAQKEDGRGGVLSSWTGFLFSNSVGCAGRNVRLARGRRCAHLVRGVGPAAGRAPQATPVCGTALSRVVRWSSVTPPPSSSPPSSCASSCVVVTLLAAFVERAAMSRLVLLTTAGEGQDHMTRRRTGRRRWRCESRLRMCTRPRSWCGR